MGTMMNRMKSAMVRASVAAAAAIFLGMTAGAEAALPGDPTAGAALWAANCSGCHDATPHSDPGSPFPASSYTPSVISAAIAGGVLAMARTQALKALTATDLTNLAAYIGVSINNATPNFEGLWWAAPGGSEAGWGINLSHQYDAIFLTWFTYDASGKAWWMVMSTTKSISQSKTYSGPIYSGHGPAFNTAPFPPLGSPGGAVAEQVGTGTLAFSDASNGTFTYTVNGTTQTKSITRELFGAQPACLFVGTPDYSIVTNYQDIWWADPAGSEAGWGMNLTHEGDQIFATWYTFGADGTPMWLVSTAAKVADKKYTGDLYQLTSGPAFSAVPFPPLGSPGGPTGGVVGSLTLTFSDGNHASFAYTVNGISQTKAITREIFSSTPTVCQ